MIAMFSVTHFARDKVPVGKHNTNGNLPAWAIDFAQSFGWSGMEMRELALA